MKKLSVAIIVVSILLSTLGTAILTVNAANVQSANKVFLGISGYPTSTSQIDSIISTMKTYGLNTYRMSFNPTWATGTHPYQQSYIQYFLDHSNFNIIVDRNHLYPPSETSAQTARNNWATVESSLMSVLKAFPNNPRVMVELINEYISSDFYPRMQGLVDDIRAAGYTNPIVVDKWNQAWTVISDPVDSTYQGYHFYFNSWSVSGAISQMQTAQSKGIKLINTEIGADFNEYSAFTSATVSELNQFLAQSASMGVGNTVWMNQNLNNMPTYQQLGLDFPTVTAPTSTAPAPSSTPSPTPAPSPSPTPNPTTTPTPTPAPAPTPTPTGSTIFQDGFESGSTSSWTSTTRSYGDTVSVTTYLPYSGNYKARFYTTGSTTTRENAYLQKSISNQDDVYASAYFRIIGSVTGTQILRDDSDRLYMLRFTDDNGNDLALAGIRRENGANKWVLYADGVSKTSSAVAVSTDTWYNVELHWNTNIAELYVNGAKILSIATSSNGSTAANVHMGIIYTYSVQNPVLLYGDNFKLSTTP